ncbi:type II secretion system protein M [Pseudidiomarina homiensis]|uniref:type II secretion system protein M n=1 Tax=Pseudidiomarina homiensis TaxID=364198 RepID=UPI00215A669E|nr:type II secretion system protein M [Pseudidiomarina homiensis]
MLQEQVHQRWQQLNSRERLLVSIAGVVLAICVVYFAMWQPLQNGIEQRELQRNAQQETLTWVRENTGRYLALSQQAQRPNRTSGAVTQATDIPRIITEQARSFQLDVGRMSPEGESLVVVMNDVPFTQVLALLDALQAQGGLNIEQLDITRGNKPGHVHVRRLKVGLA